MKAYILDIIHMNNDYTGNGMYMALYFITLLFVGFYIREKKIKDAVLLPSLLMLLGVYMGIPFVHHFIFSVYDDEIRARFFWILMAPAVAALGFTLFVKHLDTQTKRVFAVLAMLPVIFFSGIFKLSDSMYQPAENFYRLPQAILDISDAVLAENEDPKLIVPYEIAHGFRQYSTRIRLLYGEDATYGRISPAPAEITEVCDQMATATPDLNYIREIAVQNDADYLVFDSVYHVFGEGLSLNVGGYTEDVNFVGDRTPTVSQNNLLQIKVIQQPENPYWDLSEFGLEYVGTYGQYLLYRFQ